MKNKRKMKFLPLLLSLFLVSCVSQRKVEPSSPSSGDSNEISSSPLLEGKRSKILYLSDGTRVADINDVKTRFYSSYGNEEAEIDFCFYLPMYPSSIETLEPYDQIVLSDVDVSKVPKKDSFLPALRNFVEEKGKSLFTFGNVLPLESLTPDEEETTGEDSSSSSTEEPTPLVTTTFNEMLPLQYDYAASHAICLLIDNSGSMDSDNRMTKAKQGAIACLDILSEKDYISIVTFSDTGKTVQALTSVKNKDQVRRSINKIKSEGGTEIIPGLKAASNQIADSKCDYK
ncbi:MAG: VWA domain-containing protein, partial [Eubacteriales bacterium]|nr:VWA domain-containing protein [Eubacteriales bacterium]